MAVSAESDFEKRPRLCGGLLDQATPGACLWNQVDCHAP
jgi:hypothetical protein